MMQVLVQQFSQLDLFAQSYLAMLLESRMAFEPFFLGLIYASFLIANEIAAIKVVRGTDPQIKALYPLDKLSMRRYLRWIYSTVFFFGYGIFVGGSWYPFFSGGAVILSAANFALNLQACHLLKYRKILLPDNTRLEIFRALGLADIATRFLVGALLSLLLGLVFAHLAFVGGSIFLGISGLQHLEKLDGVAESP